MIHVKSPSLSLTIICVRFLVFVCVRVHVCVVYVHKNM